MTPDLVESLDALCADMSLTDVRQLQESLRRGSRNTSAWTYTITGVDRSPYLTRTLLPRVRGWRPLIHDIHRDDIDPHPHNHPWAEAYFRVVSGGYVDERWFLDAGEWRSVRRLLRPGDVNALRAIDLHRAVEVLPDTITVGLVGRRVQDWGFLVDGAILPHTDYFVRRGFSHLGGIS